MMMSFDFDKTQGIVPLFAAQADVAPDRIAVSFGERHLTYGELARRSDSLARQLRRLGVLPGSAVAILARPGLEIIVGILGIMKCGAAYVPLDHTYPQDRLDYLVNDSAATLVLAEKESVHRFVGCTAPAVTLRAIGEDSPAVEPEWQFMPELDTLAYVIYTSGTTGRPKGVEVTHKNIASTLRVIHASSDWQANDVGLLKYSLGFDSSVVEMFAPLTVGARLIVAAENQRRDPAELARLVRTHRVTQLDIVPALLAELLRQPNTARELLSLRLVISGGDVLSTELANLFYDVLPNAVLENHYGPTETTNDNTIWRCVPGWAEAIVPIGHPVQGTEIHILGPDGKTILDGTVGEIYITGAAVSRGYRGQPDTTRQRFLQDPNSDNPADRMYRTGDLGRRRSDGAIEFHGRADRQLSIGGFRVEPEEIEAALTKHPTVRSSAVRMAAAGEGPQLLVAYLTGFADQPIDVPSLRDHLTVRLPGHMMPGRFITLDELPLNGNGKVDYRLLPSPDAARPDLAVSYRPPQTAVQHEIVRLWSEILGIGSMGIDDDFFHLGGTSLLAIQVVGRINAQFAVELALPVVFEHPTIATLSSVIERSETDRGNDELERGLHDLLLAEAVAEPVQEGVAHTSELRLCRPEHILITGATDFIGINLLQRLSNCAISRITCLVHAENQAIAWTKLHQALHTYEIKLAEGVDVRVVPGDLRLPHLGLSADAYNALASSVDVVFHNGAQNNLARPYSALRATNVTGTREVLRFATQGRVKSVHFSSTISVMPWKTQTGDDVWREKDVASPQGLTYGYAQSKWVGESLVRAARHYGIPATVLRFGRIVGNKETGMWPREDFISRLIRGGIAVGKLPERNIAEPWVPVDQAVANVLEIASKPDAFGQIFHLTDGPMVDFNHVTTWLRHYGYAMEIEPVATWTSRIANQVANPAYPVISVLSSSSGDGKSPYRSQHNPFDHRNVTALLGPRLDSDSAAMGSLLHRFLDRCVLDGQVPPPTCV
ncbi:amino acid adenylation domain-containing protein [Nocardia sp. NPDC051321]|uniref:amino acid adenylation domain-containing protein n=1 Tax=Nocardia sp. NPDC051321 TaxID=3364323 RepID=UPI00379993AA